MALPSSFCWATSWGKGPGGITTISPTPRMIAVAAKQNIADRTGNHISSLSDFKTAKLCPRRSQLRESVSMRFSLILESAIQALTGRSQQIVSVHVNDCPHNREPALVPAPHWSGSGIGASARTTRANRTHLLRNCSRSQFPLNLNVNSCIVFAQPFQSPLGSCMSTASVTVQPVSWFRPKYLLIALFGLMVAYVLGHNESFLVNPNAPVWQHYQPFKWWLLPHGIAGACAFVLAPMQFSDRLRQRYAKLHRVAGRVYVAGACIAGPMGIYIAALQERLGAPRFFSMIAVAHGSLWMLKKRGA